MGANRTGIPTQYGGIWFRSRLEARWAAFFDAVGWRWDYEPIDLDGYIPDFLLHIHKPTLVEVKPAMRLADLYAREYLDKIENGGWEGETLLVGSGPFCSDDWSGTAIGILDGPWQSLGEGEAPLAHDWGEALFQRCAKCEVYSFFHGANSYQCRVSGCQDGDHYLMPCSPIGAWREACNATQWRGGRAARSDEDRIQAKKVIKYKPELGEMSARLWAALNPSGAPPEKP